MRTAFCYLICAMALTAQQTGSGEKGSIEGVVINQVTNAPIKKAQLNVAGMQLATDTSGHFIVDQLAAGTYELSAWHPNFPPPLSPSSVPNVRVTLQPGEHKKDIVIAMVPGVTLSGKVLDEDGDPLSGCVVQVMRYSYQGGKRELRQMNAEQVDDRGDYRIVDLSAGSYYLKAVCRRQIRAPRPFAPKDAPINIPEETYADQFYPGSADSAGATKLKPPPGGELRDLDFRMRKLHAVSIRGKVTRPEGADIHQFVQILAVPKNSPDPGTIRGGQVAPTGEFEVHGLYQGSYSLAAHNYDPETPLYGRIDVEVGDASIHDLVLPMYSGITLSGTVEVESPPAGVTPSADHPTNNQTRRIWLYPEDSVNRFQNLTPEVRTNGEFAIPGVTPGDWRLNCELQPGTYIKSVHLGDQEVSPEHLTIPQGATGPLKIVLGTNPGEIDGRVQVDNTLSGGNIVVMLLPDAPSRPEFQPANQTVPDTTGRFSFRSVAPGKYRLFATESGPDFPQGFGLGDVLKSLGEEVTVEEGSHVTKQIKPIPTSAVADALRDLE